MKVQNNYQNKKYTKIVFPITLKKTHSMSGDKETYFDADYEDYCEENCYIEGLFVEKIHIRKFTSAKNNPTISEAKWNVEVVIPEYKDENETILIVNNVCRELSLNYSLAYRCFQCGGFKGFTFREMDIKRYYSYDNCCYENPEINMHSVAIERKTVVRIKSNIFSFPKISVIHDKLFEDLKLAFIHALKSDDDVSRFLLLYYAFEIIYGTPEYKEIEKSNGKISKDKNLMQYLSLIGVEEYCSFDETFGITEEIIFDIIKTRNDLAHRADTSRINKILYGHLLPIIQQVLVTLRNQQTPIKIFFLDTLL